MSKKAIFSSFLVGFACGVASVWLYLDNKYAKIANDEVASIRETFYKISEKPVEEEVIEEEPKDHNGFRSSIMEEIKTDKQFINYSDLSNKLKGEKSNSGSYVIHPEKFGLHEDYETREFTYYSDKVLADEEDNLLEYGDVINTVGYDSLETFGLYEEDSIYVQNDDQRCYYCVFLDNSDYDSFRGGRDGR